MFIAAQCWIWGFLKKSTHSSSYFASASWCFETDRCHLSFSIKPELALFLMSPLRTQGATVLKYPFQYEPAGYTSPAKTLKIPSRTSEEPPRSLSMMFHKPPCLQADSREDWHSLLVWALWNTAKLFLAPAWLQTQLCSGDMMEPRWPWKQPTKAPLCLWQSWPAL